MISCNNLVTSMAVEAWLQQWHAANGEQRALNARVKKLQQRPGITLGSPWDAPGDFPTTFCDQFSANQKQQNGHDREVFLATKRLARR